MLVAFYLAKKVGAVSFDRSYNFDYFIEVQNPNRTKVRTWCGVFSDLTIKFPA